MLLYTVCIKIMASLYIYIYIYILKSQDGNITSDALTLLDLIGLIYT